MSTSRHFILIAAATVGLVSGMTASAANDADAPSVVVSFAELDLSTQKGVDVLYARLRAAAKDVCAPLDGRELKRHVQYRACVSEALDNAVQQVANPKVTAVHAINQSRAA